MTEVPIAQDRRSLRSALVLGALYDLILGVFMIGPGPATMRLLGAPLEGSAAYWFRLSALPLLILPVFYFSAARSQYLDAFRTPVLALRGLGGGFVLASLLLGPRPAWLVAVVGLLDLAWAVLYLKLWRQDER